MNCLLTLLLMLAALGWAEISFARPIETKPVIVNVRELPGLRHSWKQIEFEGPPRFDATSQFVCLTGHAWATNADFTEELHYVILNTEGIVQTSSESTTDMNLLAKFPDLAVKLSHRGLISRDNYTNMFLDSGRWLVAPDLSWCVRVRQMADLSDLVEKFALQPAVEKQWTWTCKGKYGPPSCQMNYILLHHKEAIAISRSFTETVLLDGATGTNIDVIPYGPGQGSVSNSAVATCIIPTRECLVCGESESKRIRVISLGNAHRILKEVGGKGINGLGTWSTVRLEPTNIAS